MARLSQSQLQAVVAAIVERQQREGSVPPEYISQINRLWIHRNLNKHLEPVFAEVADKIGLDKNKIDEAVARHQEEASQYLKEREPETDKNFAVLTKTYREALANRKAALDEVTVNPPIKPPIIPPPVLVVLDKPGSIYGQPSGLLAEENIESWNSWAKVIWSANDVQTVRLTFFFSWLNDSDDAVVITGATSSLTARGKCSLHVDPGLLTPDYADLWLWPDLKVFVGQTQIDDESTVWIAEFKAYATANIFGGTAHTDTHDVWKTVGVSCLQEILVPGRQPVIFGVEMRGLLSTLHGKITLQFDREPFIHCPTLIVAFLEPLISFSETLIADDLGWEGYCLVQRIEPVRLSRSGTQVKLTLRAASVGASIDRIYISQADPAGQPFDSASDLTAVTSAPIVIAANTEVTLPPVNYRFDETKPLLIAVDFGATPASGIRYTDAVTPQQASAYHKLGAEAANATRAGFTAYPGLYLIERIEVS